MIFTWVYLIVWSFWGSSGTTICSAPCDVRNPKLVSFAIMVEAFTANAAWSILQMHALSTHAFMYQQHDREPNHLIYATVTQTTNYQLPLRTLRYIYISRKPDLSGSFRWRASRERSEKEESVRGDWCRACPALGPFLHRGTSLADFSHNFVDLRRPWKILLKRFLPKRSKITKIGPEGTKGIDFRWFLMPWGLPFSVQVSWSAETSLFCNKYHTKASFLPLRAF